MGVGRPKSYLIPLEDEDKKMDYFLHEKPLIIERVRDLSILTGVDVLYIVFDPFGRPFICLGQNTEFREIIRRYAAVPFKERERRRASNFETLRTGLEKQGRAADVNIQELRNTWKRKRLDERNEELRNQKQKLSVVDHKSSLLACPTNIKDVELIEKMAEPLRNSIDGLRKRKDHLNKLRQEIQDEAAAEQVPAQLSPSLHNGTIHQGVHENLKQSMFQRNAEPDAFPTMSTQNVESRADLDSIGFDLDFMEEFDNLSSFSFSSFLQDDEAEPNNVNDSSSPYFGDTENTTFSLDIDKTN